MGRDGLKLSPPGDNELFSHKRHKKHKNDLIESFVLFVPFVAYNAEPFGRSCVSLINVNKVNYV